MTRAMKSRVIMHDHPTPIVIIVPCVLAVGCSEEVLASIGPSLEGRGVALRTSDLIALRADSTRLRPLVLLVDVELYEFDSPGFDAVARDVGAQLGIAGNVMEAELVLERLLDGARVAPRSSR